MVRECKKYLPGEKHFILELSRKGHKPQQIVGMCSKKFGTNRTPGAISALISNLKSGRSLYEVIDRSNREIMNPALEKRSLQIYAHFLNQANLIRAYDEHGNELDRDYKKLGLGDILSLPELEKNNIIKLIQNGGISKSEFGGQIDLMLVPYKGDRTRDKMKLVLPLEEDDKPVGLRVALYNAMERSFIGTGIYRYNGEDPRGNWRALVTYDMVCQDRGKGRELKDRINQELNEYGATVSIRIDSPQFRVLDF